MDTSELPTKMDTIHLPPSHCKRMALVGKVSLTA